VWGFTIPVLISFFNAILLVGFPSLRTDPILNTMATLTFGVFLLVSTLLIPLTLAFAIFRYRLWQIDIILNRTLVYGSLTGLVTAVYVLLVGGFGTLAVSEQSNLAALLVAMVIVVWGIRPLHYKLQTRVDRWLPPPSPTPQTATKNKVPRLVWLRMAWGIYILLTLVLFAAGLVHQAQNGFWQQPAAEVLAVAPLLANPFNNDFFLGNDLYPYVLAGGYIQAAVFVIVGLFLFWRKSGDVMGVLASGMLIAIGLGFTATIVFLPVLEPAWHLPTSLFQAGLFGSAFLFLCLFPNGRFYPHWTRTAAIIWLGYVLLWLPFPQLNLHRATVIWPAVIFGAVMWLGVVAQLLRYRRISSGDEKQQTKWVIAGFAAANFGLAGIAVLLSLGASYSAALLTAAVLTLALMPVFIPLSIGVALLRYRLWQIDIILNRSLVYGGLSLGIVTVYALTVGTLSLLFKAQNSLLISLLATGLIAVLFQPVRERLQRTVNKMTFGDRDDPAAVLARLGQRLEAISQPNAVLPAIVETVAQALKLPYVVIVLAGEQGGRGEGVMAEVGVHFDAPLQSFPLVYQTETIGQLQVAARSPGEVLSEADEQVLRQVALQAGTAVRAIRLTQDLQQSRIRLVTTREEERRRLRRDLHDELGPTLASQTFALDAALDLLETDPQAAAKLLQSLKAQNQETVAEIRRLVHELRPPTLDELGVMGALQVHVAQLNGHHTLHIHITAQPDPLPSLPAAVEVAAYRIALEAITNVVRHAQARRCDVDLKVVGNGRAQLQIVVTDNGIGFSSKLHLGVGLISMRERAEELGGRYEITTGPNGGTRLTAVLPLVTTQGAE
jgi:signal transduction histidine kinase